MVVRYWENFLRLRQVKFCRRLCGGVVEFLLADVSKKKLDRCRQTLLSYYCIPLEKQSTCLCLSDLALYIIHNSETVSVKIINWHKSEDCFLSPKF